MIILFSQKYGEINKFLNKFYNKTFDNFNSLSWKKVFSNPIELSEFIAVFIDNINLFEINMWISLDTDIFIKISPKNANTVIKYLFERYPY